MLSWEAELIVSHIIGDDDARARTEKPVQGPRTFTSETMVLNPAKGEKFRNLNAIARQEGLLVAARARPSTTFQ